MKISYKLHDDIPLVDFHLIFEIPSFFKKNDELDFWFTLNLIFAGYTDSKKQVRTRQKIKFIKLVFSN